MPKTPSVPQDEFVVDMTTAKTLEPLEPTIPYLMKVSAFKKARSGAGNRKVHIELTVAEPESDGKRKCRGSKVFDDISLEDDNTKGRLLLFLRALGNEDEKIKVAKFVIPEEEDVLGMEVTAWVRTQVDPNGVFPDKSVIRRLRPASAYAEATGL